MNQDQVKGALNDAAGRAKRQVGEWTGDKETQVDGAAQQIKGKAQKAWGDVKDAAHDARKKVEERVHETPEDRERREEKERKEREERTQTHPRH